MSDMSLPECEGNKSDLKMGLEEDHCAVGLPAGVRLEDRDVTAEGGREGGGGGLGLGLGLETNPNPNQSIMQNSKTLSKCVLKFLRYVGNKIPEPGTKSKSGVNPQIY